MLEQDMFEDIKDHLVQLGYKVKAEVLNTDITAVKNDEIIIIEMKSTLTTRLMYQGCKRQRICDYVYIAIQKPTTRVLKSTQFKEKIHLVRRLNLGLIFVDIDKSVVETYLDPKTFAFKQSKIKRRKLLKEFEQRITSFNKGGVTKTKIITAYRETAILIADYIREEPMKLKDIKTHVKSEKCSSIMQKNYYGWFERIDRGVYGLTVFGKEEIKKYNHVLKEILDLRNNKIDV